MALPRGTFHLTPDLILPLAPFAVELAVLHTAYIARGDGFLVQVHGALVISVLLHVQGDGAVLHRLPDKPPDALHLERGLGGVTLLAVEGVGPRHVLDVY